MKKFLLTFLLTTIVLGQGCRENDSVHTYPYGQKAIMPRDQVSDLADAIAEDATFGRLVETVLDFMTLVDSDDALADSTTAYQFFHDSNDSICLNITQFDSLLTVYDFSERSAILSSLNKIIIIGDSIVSNYSLNNLSEPQKFELIALTWENFLDSPPQGQPGEGCCDDYKAALRACLVDAVVWLVGTWTTYGLWKSVPITPSPFYLADQAYACIRKADEQYKPCCPD